MMLKRIALGMVICLLCAFGLSSCMLALDIEYTFENKSSYTIIVSLSEPYANYKSEGDSKKTNTSDIYVYSGYQTPVSIYVDKADVSYTWRTYNTNDITKVTCTTNGSTATFKNRY